MKYIIKLDGEYYGGSVFKYQGEKYGYEVPKVIAQRYNTPARAEHIKNRLIRTCVNATNAEVEEV